MRLRAPVTRVFSRYVVQAGSACRTGAAGLPRQRSTGLVRSSGRPGDSCPGFAARLVLNVAAGSLSPLLGEEGLGASGRVRECAGQAASGWLRAGCWQAPPAAVAGSQLVPWTTME